MVGNVRAGLRRLYLPCQSAQVLITTTPVTGGLCMRAHLAGTRKRPTEWKPTRRNGLNIDWWTISANPTHSNDCINIYINDGFCEPLSRWLSDTGILWQHGQASNNVFRSARRWLCGKTAATFSPCNHHRSSYSTGMVTVGSPQPPSWCHSASDIG